MTWPAWLVIASGVLIAMGSVLPWFSLFAGLQPYRGTTGLYGQIVFGTGVLAILCGAALLHRDTRFVNSAMIATGATLTSFTVWLLAGLMNTYQTLLENPMYVARLEPGLFVVIAGATTLTLVAGYMRLVNAARRV